MVIKENSPSQMLVLKNIDISFDAHLNNVKNKIGHGGPHLFHEPPRFDTVVSKFYDAVTDDFKKFPISNVLLVL